MRRWYVLFSVGLIAILGLALASCDEEEEEGGDETPAATEPATTEPSGETPGVTDTEVILGTHTSLTGPTAAYNIIPQFTKAYFDYINSTEGGVNRRQITYIQKDDQYSPPLAVGLPRPLVQPEGLFARFNALG